MLCLDTTAVLDLVRREGHARKIAVERALARSGAQGAMVMVTRATLCELEVGVCLSSRPAAERDRLKPVLSSVGVLELTRASVEWYGKIGAGLRRKGEHIGDMDVLIAAMCGAHGCELVTGNSRHFARIPGLSVIEY